MNDNDSISSVDSPSRRVGSPHRVTSVPPSSLDPPVPSVALEERSELLVVGRSDVSNRLADAESREEKREAELYRLRSLNTSLTAQLESMQKQLEDCRAMAQEQRQDFETQVVETEALCSRRLEDAGDAIKNLEKRNRAIQKDLDETRQHAGNCKQLAEEWEAKATGLERRVKQYTESLDRNTNVDTTRRDNEVSRLQDEVLSKESKAIEFRQKCAELSSELHQSRSYSTVLHHQVKMLEDERNALQQQLSSWEAKSKAGRIVDTQHIAEERDAQDRLQEQLDMVHNTNHRLLLILKDSAEFGEFIRSVPGDPQDFFFCPSEQQATTAIHRGRVEDGDDRSLVTRGAGRQQSTPRGMAPSMMTRNAEYLRTAVASHTAASRTSTVSPGVLNAMIERRTEKEFWVPRQAFEVGSSFLAAWEGREGLTLESFYPLFVALNKVWYERMKNRHYATSLSSAQNQHAKKSTKSSAQPLTGTLAAEVQALMRQSRLMRPSKEIEKLLGTFERICMSAIRERNAVQEECKTLRRDLHGAMGSRDPHVSHLKTTVLQLVEDCRRASVRLSSKVTQLTGEFDRAVDTMHLVSSWRAVMTSFSQTVRDTVASDVDRLCHLADAAELAGSDADFVPHPSAAHFSGSNGCGGAAQGEGVRYPPSRQKAYVDPMDHALYC